MTRLDIDLGYDPRGWQQACHLLRRAKPEKFRGDWIHDRSVVDVLVLVVHRRAGKTIWCILELCDAALEFKGGDGRFAYIAPELKQAKRNAWDYLKAYASRVPGTRIHEAELYVEFANGSRISLYGADSPDSLRGIYLDGAVLDEVALMKPETWDPVVSIALMDRHGWAVFIGTVNGVDLLSEVFFKAGASGFASGNCAAASYDVYTTNVFTPAQIEEKRASMSEQHFRREFMNDFTAGGEDQLISLDKVLVAMKRHARTDAFDFAPRILTVDVAFAESGDRAVIYRRQGCMVWEPEVHRGIENMVLAARVAVHVHEWDPDVVLVDNGRGEGVRSRLRQLNIETVGVDFGGKPDSPRFVNKKAEIFCRLRDFVIESACLPDRPDLRIDLCGLKVDISQRTGKIEVLYDEGLPSPDEAASLAMGFAFMGTRAKARTELERFEAQARQSKQDSGYGAHFWDRATGKR